MLALLYLPFLLLAPLFTLADSQDPGQFNSALSASPEVVRDFLPARQQIVCWADSRTGKGHGKRYYPWNHVKWTMNLKSVKADTTIDLTWKGGSGNGYEVYYIPQWEGQDTFEVSACGAQRHIRTYPYDMLRKLIRCSPSTLPLPPTHPSSGTAQRRASSQKERPCESVPRERQR